MEEKQKVQVVFEFDRSEYDVAPHAGAWIETCLTSIVICAKFGRTSCGCVD